MKAESLKLQPGTALQLQLQHRENERLIARVIGYCPHKSILVATPKVNSHLVPLRIDQKVTVRFFSNTVACAFESKVLNICTHPFHYFHILYPSEIASDEIRKAQRISSELPASFYNQNARQVRHEGIITDISTSGIRLTSTRALGDKGDSINIRASIQLAHVNRLLSVDGIIRSKAINQTDVNTYIYGIEFGDLRDDDFLLLSGFIYAQIVENGNNL